jgi:DNA-binding response OmpR family regulator
MTKVARQRHLAVVAPHPGPAPRLLIVDEHPINLAVLPRSFRVRGYACETASSTAEALEAMTREVFDVVVLEWYSPTGHRTDLPARLRACAASQQRDIVIIALSVLDEAEAPLVRVVVDDYFVKPAPIALIDGRIRELLASAHK